MMDTWRAYQRATLRLRRLARRSATVPPAASVVKIGGLDVSCSPDTFLRSTSCSLSAHFWGVRSPLPKRSPRRCSGRARGGPRSPPRAPASARRSSSGGGGSPPSSSAGSPRCRYSRSRPETSTGSAAPASARRQPRGRRWSFRRPASSQNFEGPETEGARIVRRACGKARQIPLTWSTGGGAASPRFRREANWSRSGEELGFPPTGCTIRRREVVEVGFVSGLQGKLSSTVSE